MSMSTIANSGGPILRPEEVGTLVVQPVATVSVAMQVATVVYTGSHDYRIPIVTDDPAAGWFAEGAEITPADAVMDEEVVTPKKVAGLTIISNELAEDSTPEASQVVGLGIARDIARKIDAAFFGNTTVNGPSGLLSLAGVSTVDIGTSIASYDVFAEAISKAEAEGAQVTTFVANPTDALALAKLKTATGSNQPLLGQGATDALDRRILGVPLLTSSAIAAGVIWAIPRDRVTIVVRRDATLAVDRSAYFSSDRVGVRATMRVGFGYPHPAAVVKMYDVA